MSLLGAQLVFDRAVRFRGNMLEWQGKYLERERERKFTDTHGKESAEQTTYQVVQGRK